MLSKNMSFVNTNQLGSSLLLPAHGWVGARATLFFLRRILQSKIQIPSASKARVRQPFSKTAKVAIGGEGGNRTHIAGFSDRCRDRLGYRPTDRLTNNF